jgi:hypothetical protein
VNYGGSGIGTGCAWQGYSGIKNLTIKNANVTGSSITSGDAAGSGIGTGSATDGGNSRIENLTIKNANVTGSSSTGGSGIGTGANAGIGLVHFSGSLTLVCDLLRAATISVSNASIVAFTRAPVLFETAPTLSGAFALAVFYGTAANASQEGWVGEVPYLSIGNLSLPLEGDWRFRVSEEDQDWSPYSFGSVRGLFIKLAGEGSYSIDAEGPRRGLLGPTEGNNTFEVPSNGHFFRVGYFIGPTPAPTPTPTPLATPSDAFVESILPISGPMTESQLAETATNAGSERFNASANLDESQLAETATHAGSDRFNASANPVATPNFNQSCALTATINFAGRTAVFVESSRFPTGTAIANTSPLSGYEASLTYYSLLSASQSLTFFYSYAPTQVVVEFTTEVTDEDGEVSITLMQSITIIISNCQYPHYVQIPIMIWEQTVVFVELTIRTYTPIITERSSALVIGLATAFGLIVAILLGAGLFLYRTAKHPEEAHYMGPHEKRRWQINPLNQPEDEADVQVEDPFKTRDFSNVKTGHYDTMADYADLTIEADEIFI